MATKIKQCNFEIRIRFEHEGADVDVTLDRAEAESLYAKLGVALGHGVMVEPRLEQRQRMLPSIVSWPWPGLQQTWIGTATNELTLDPDSKVALYGNLGDIQKARG